MKVSYLIKHRQEEYKPDEEIMVQWYAKEHIESFESEQFGNEISEELWDFAVHLFEKYELSAEEFGVFTCLQEAQERLEASS